MKILYAISAANFFLLLWIAAALSRHIRRTADSEERAAEEREAARQAAQATRPVRTVYEEQSPEIAVERRASPRPAPFAQPQTTEQEGDRRIRPDRRETGGSLYGSTYDGLYAPSKPGPVSIAPDLAQSRKIRYASTGRLDPAYFNKDAGDLTDPDAPVKTRADGSKPTRRY